MSDTPLTLEAQEQPGPTCGCCDEQEVVRRWGDPDYDFEACFCECHLTIEERLSVRTGERDKRTRERDMWIRRYHELDASVRVLIAAVEANG